MSILIHAFDIETSSRSIGPGSLMSIGMCCMELQPNGRTELINSFFEVIEWPDGLVYDDVTREFWRTCESAHMISTTNGKPPHQVANALREHLNHVQCNAEKRRAKYRLVTDNAWFDVSWLDWFLCTYSEEKLPLRHSKVFGYIPQSKLVDVSERSRVLQNIGVNLTPIVYNRQLHHPYNDAIYIAQRFIQIHRMSRFIKNQK